MRFYRDRGRRLRGPDGVVGDMGARAPAFRIICRFDKWVCYRTGTRKNRGVCFCGRLGLDGRMCGWDLCREVDGTPRPRWVCPCAKPDCGISRCEETNLLKVNCPCGNPNRNCGNGLVRRLLNYLGGSAFLVNMTGAEIEKFLGYTSDRLRRYLLATHRGDAQEVARKWAAGDLDQDHIEACAAVLKRTGMKFFQDGKFTQAAWEVSQLWNLQLMDSFMNRHLKRDKFTDSAKAALAQRKALFEGLNLEDEDDFELLLERVRKHVNEDGVYDIGDPARYP